LLLVAGFELLAGKRLFFFDIKLPIRSSQERAASDQKHYLIFAAPYFESP
jgi:hypothetical protein